MSDTANCLFCAIISGKIPARILDQNAEVVVFLSLENHPLVVTRRHIADVFAMSAEQGAAVMNEAIKIAKAMRIGLAPDGIYLGQANGEAAGQEVSHYHLHLYPRWKDGRLPGTDEAAKDATFEALKKALAK
ncbi:MAG TPA: HIT family protein [Candidatus Binataceae bacterium]|nr:HIT family protein [Candidatus Binataceae bacterium]